MNINTYTGASRQQDDTVYNEYQYIYKGASRQQDDTVGIGINFIANEGNREDQHIKQEYKTII